MSTRSTIWLKTDSGYDGIYCHHDGYLDHVGEILKSNYYTVETISELLKKGSMSYIESTISECGYYVDKGEEIQIYHIDSYESITKYSEEYNYIFEDGVWYYFKNEKLKEKDTF